MVSAGLKLMAGRTQILVNGRQAKDMRGSSFGSGTTVVSGATVIGRYRACHRQVQIITIQAQSL